MCKRRTELTATVDLPAEGPTIRLDRRAAEAAAECVSEQPQRRAEHCQHGWWSLWLIWPLIGLVKGLLPLLSSALATISQALLSVPLLVSIVLIVVGLVLLRRD